MYGPSAKVNLVRKEEPRVTGMPADAPNVPDAIVGMDIITPLDLEKRFGITEGNIFQRSTDHHRR